MEQGQKLKLSGGSVFGLTNSTVLYGIGGNIIDLDFNKIRYNKLIASYPLILDNSKNKTTLDDGSNILNIDLSEYYNSNQTSNLIITSKNIFNKPFNSNILTNEITIDLNATGWSNDNIYLYNLESNVGIGTSTPSSLLHLQVINNDYTNCAITFSTDENNLFKIGYNNLHDNLIFGTITQQNIYNINKNAPNNSITITPDGVGIGTSTTNLISRTYKMYVAGSLNTDNLYINGTNYDNIITTATSNLIINKINETASNLTLSGDGSNISNVEYTNLKNLPLFQYEYPYLTSNNNIILDLSIVGGWTTASINNSVYNIKNNIGIGNTNPLELLHIGSTTDPSKKGAIILSTYYSSISPSFKMGFDLYNNFIIGGFDISSSNWIKQFYINSNAPANSLIIKNNGYIGIGTSSPLYTLDVNGNINTNSSLISANIYNSNLIISTNIYSSNLIISTDIYSSNLISSTDINNTNVITSKEIKVSSLITSNIIFTNLLSGNFINVSNIDINSNMNVKNLLTTLNLSTSNLITTNNLNVNNLLTSFSLNISNNINTSNIYNSNLIISCNLNIGNRILTSNINVSNLITSNSLIASNINTLFLNINSNLISSNATITNLFTANNINSSNLNISNLITTSNLNILRNLTSSNGLFSNISTLNLNAYDLSNANSLFSLNINTSNINSSNIISSNLNILNNIGIKTSNIYADLQIGDINTNSNYSFILCGSNNLFKIGYDNFNNFSFGNFNILNNNWFSQFYINSNASSNSLIINSNGRVGINTNITNYNLHVNGSINATSIFCNNIKILSSNETSSLLNLTLQPYITSNSVSNIFTTSNYVNFNISSNFINGINNLFSLNTNILTFEYKLPSSTFISSTSNINLTTYNDFNFNSFKYNIIVANDDNQYTNGTYNIFVSSIFNNNISTFNGNILLDNLLNFNTKKQFQWGAANYTNGIYSGPPSYLNINDNYNGDFFVIKFPRNFLMTKFRFYTKIGAIFNFPLYWKCYGSTDGLNFFNINEAHNSRTFILSDNVYTNPNTNIIYNYYEKILPSSYNKIYNYIGFVVNRIYNISATSLTLASVEIFGKISLNNLFITSNNFLNYNNQLFINYLTTTSNIYTNEYQFPTTIYNSFTTNNIISITPPLPDFAFNCYSEQFTIYNSNIYYGNGTYNIYSSSTGSTSNNITITNKHLLFNYLSTSYNTYWKKDSYINGNNNTHFNLNDNYYGEFIVLKLPTNIILSKYIISVTASEINKAPSDWICYGSKDGSVFNRLSVIQKGSFVYNTDDLLTYYYQQIIPNLTNTSYNYIGFVFNKLNGLETQLALSSIQLYGYQLLQQLYINSNSLSNQLTSYVPYSSINNIINSCNYVNTDQLNLKQDKITCISPLILTDTSNISIDLTSILTGSDSLDNLSNLIVDYIGSYTKIWNYSPNSLNNIYYTSGSVGISTNKPNINYALDVFGNINSSNINVSNIITASNFIGNGFNLSNLNYNNINNAPNLSNLNNWIYNNGNVYYTNSGYIGIGITAGTQLNSMLTVRGSIYSSNIINCLNLQENGVNISNIYMSRTTASNSFLLISGGTINSNLTVNSNISARNFIENGVLLSSKYLTSNNANTIYQAILISSCNLTVNNINANVLNINNINSTLNISSSNFIENGISLAIKYLTSNSADTIYQTILNQNCNLNINNLNTSNLTSLSNISASNFIENGVSLTSKYLTSNSANRIYQTILNQNCNLNINNLNTSNLICVSNISASNFIENGSSLSSKYLTQINANIIYQPILLSSCNLILNNIQSSNLNILTTTISSNFVENGISLVSKYLTINNASNIYQNILISSCNLNINNINSSNLNISNNISTSNLNASNINSLIVMENGNKLSSIYLTINNASNIYQPIIIQSCNLNINNLICSNLINSNIITSNLIAISNINASNFIENGSSLSSKYLTQINANIIYQPILLSSCNLILNNLNTSNIINSNNLITSNLITNFIQVNSNIITNNLITSNLTSSNLISSNIQSSNLNANNLILNSNLFTSNIISSNITINSNLLTSNVNAIYLTINSNINTNNLFVNTNLTSSNINTNNLTINSNLISSNINANNLTINSNLLTSNINANNLTINSNLLSSNINTSNINTINLNVNSNLNTSNLTVYSNLQTNTIYNSNLLITSNIQILNNAIINSNILANGVINSLSNLQENGVNLNNKYLTIINSSNQFLLLSGGIIT